MLKVALGGALLVTATHSLALSLGGVQGSAIIGRPLDILVQGSIDAAEVSSGLCLEAEVIYGDVRLPASAISTAIQRLGSEGKGAVRVRVNTPVNEPLVMVAIKAGCPTSFTRSYTLLADFEAAASAPVRESSLPLPAVQSTQPSTTRSVESTPKRSGASAIKRQVATPASGVSDATAKSEVAKTATPVRLHAPRPRPAGVVRLSSKLKPVVVQTKPEDDKRVDAGALVPADQKPAATAPAGPRLKLDPVDAAPVVNGTVGPVGATPSASTADPAAPNQPAPAQDAAREADDSVVQQELQQLRDEQQRMRLAMETMNRQLAEAQQSRYSNPMIYGLGALALLLAGGLVWLARKRNQTPALADSQADPWWTVGEPEIEQASTEALALAPQVQGETVSTASVASDTMEAELPGLQVSETSESVFLETPISKIEVHSLVDLWQQVAFFESLGQHAEATYALQTFVRQFPRGSEAPYLFWLKLADQQDDDKAYSQAQALYEQHFHRLVPVNAGSAPLDLTDDANFMRQLALAWKEGSALELIERALVSQPGDPASALQVRTAQSFDDLLVLHGVLEALPTIAEAQQPAAATSAEWMSITQVQASPASGTPSAAAPVTNQIDASSTSPNSGNLLDFQLPDAEPGVQAEVKQPVAETKKELPSLDFEFDDFPPPPPKSS